MAKVVLDTSVMIDFLANRGAANRTAELLEADEGAVSAIVVFELFCGVKSAAHRQTREELLSLCQVLPISGAVARRAASLYTILSGKGTTIANQDLLIAATCLEFGLALHTENRRDFKRIPGLALF